MVHFTQETVIIGKRLSWTPQFGVYREARSEAFSVCQLKELIDAL
jgi:hypothetical protein